MPTDTEQAAWQRYLEATRGLAGPQYAEVEPWAWTQLRKQLTAIRRTFRAKSPTKTRSAG